MIYDNTISAGIWAIGNIQREVLSVRCVPFSSPSISSFAVGVDCVHVTNVGGTEFRGRVSCGRVEVLDYMYVGCKVEDPMSKQNSSAVERLHTVPEMGGEISTECGNEPAPHQLANSGIPCIYIITRYSVSISKM